MVITLRNRCFAILVARRIGNNQDGCWIDRVRIEDEGLVQRRTNDDAVAGSGHVLTVPRQASLEQSSRNGAHASPRRDAEASSKRSQRSRHMGLPTVASIDERRGGLMACHPPRRGVSVRLAREDNVKGRGAETLLDDTQECARSLQGVVEIAVTNPPAEVVSPDVHDTVPQLSEGADSLPDRARSSGVRVGRCVRHREKAERSVGQCGRNSVTHCEPFARRLLRDRPSSDFSAGRRSHGRSRHASAR